MVLLPHRQRPGSNALLTLLLIATLLAVQIVAASSPSLAANPDRAQVEPTARPWRTWVLSSGSELRRPPPPDRRATRC